MVQFLTRDIVLCVWPAKHNFRVFFREKLKQLIEKRIGKENFVEKLGFITKHELYSRAALKPQPVFQSPEQMLFDHEFTKLVKELEGQSRACPEIFSSALFFFFSNWILSVTIAVTGVITKAVHKSSEEDKKEEEVKKTLEQHDNIVTQYKELIREQVRRFCMLIHLTDRAVPFLRICCIYLSC